MAKYKHLFFDLDHTLWDYDRNSRETLIEMHERFGLACYQPNVGLFCNEFFRNNEEQWALFRSNKIRREELNVNRFAQTLSLPSNDELVLKVSQFFIAESPKRSHLIAGVMETLGYLKSKGYFLYIVTNGYCVMQEQKIKSSGIGHFFTKIYTSEGVGAKKPHRDYFEYAIKSSNASKKESLVIGDNFEADILGAKNFGIDQVFFNPSKKDYLVKATFEIADISEMQTFL